MAHHCPSVSLLDLFVPRYNYVSLVEYWGNYLRRLPIALFDRENVSFFVDFGHGNVFISLLLILTENFTLLI